MIPLSKQEGHYEKSHYFNNFIFNYFFIYGHRIFKSKAKALKQFKKEYAVTLDFLKNEGFGEFNTSYDTLSKYARESWQYTVYEHVDNEELIKKQLFGVSSFLYTYFESDFRTYFPFNWTLS